MTALDELYLRRRRIQDALARIVVDAERKPDRPLPDCPECEKSSLFVSAFQVPGRNLFGCYGCSFVFECPAPEAQPAPKPSKPIGAELEAFAEQHRDNDLIFRLFRVYRAQISSSLATVVDIAALGEVRWAHAFTTIARNDEICALRHLRAVLERKAEGKAT